MSQSFYANMEHAIKENSDRGIEVLEHYYGVDLGLYRERRTGNVYGKVHGKNSGKEGELIDRIIGILVSDDFFPSTGKSSGSFLEGFMFTRCKDVKTGDIIKIDSEDGKQRRYKIESKDGLGMTTEIITKWKISSIGD